MKTMTVIAASVLAAAVSAHAEDTTSKQQSIAIPYGAPYTMPAAPAHFEARQARIQAIHQEQFKAHQAAMEQMAKMQEEMARVHQTAFQGPAFEAPRFEAPTFDGPMTRAEVDALFEERRQEMDARFAKAEEEMKAARATFGSDYPLDRPGVDRPEFPAASDNGRYEEHLKRVEAGRKAAEERMAGMRAAAEQDRAERYTGSVL